MATLLVQLLILGVLVGAHAQSDFCEGVPTRQLRNVDLVKENVQLRYLKPGDPTPLLTGYPHDLIAGNCSSLGQNRLTQSDCAEPVLGGVAFVDHGYTFLPGSVIYCIKSLDRLEDGNGGFPVILSGGVGSDRVILNYYSQRDRGLRFYTEVYATIRQ